MLLVFVLGTSMSGLAQSEKSAFESVVEQISNKVAKAQSGTTYGIVESTPEKYVVNTPIGKYEVKKNNGTFSCLGLWAKLESSRKNEYVVNSSLGRYRINLKKCTVTKL